MTTPFTELDLIRYLYGESSENEQTEIETAAACDSDFGEELFDIKFDLSLLDRLTFRPSEVAFKSILRYSLDYPGTGG